MGGGMMMKPMGYKAGKSVKDVPEHVTNALTRDYSGLMKAIDKKKG